MGNEFEIEGISKIAEKLDSQRLLYIHVNRCLEKMTVKDIYGFKNAVEGLKMLCDMFRDAVYKEEIGLLRHKLNLEIKKWQHKDGSIENSKLEGLEYKHTKELMNSCMALIHRRGMMFMEMAEETI